MRTPPRVLEAIAERLAEKTSAPYFVGDLREEYGQRLRRSTLLTANLWYAAEIIAALVNRLTETGSTKRRRRKRTSMFGMVLHDVVFALRTFRRRPMFTAVALLTLAIGIGSTTAVFSIVDGIVFRELSYPDADRLYQVWPAKTFSYEMLDQFREEVVAFEEVASVGGWRLSLIGVGDPVSLNGAAVSANFFDLLGAHPLIGRVFREGDDLPTNSDIAILSYDFWVTRFGADSSVIGRRIRLGGAEHDSRVVVGVMPRDFQPLYSYLRAWVPATIDLSRDDYDSSWWNEIYARRDPNVPVEVAQEQVAAFAERSQQRRFTRISDEQVALARAIPLHEVLTGEMRQPLFLLLGGIALVLLVACANVTNLMLSLGGSRERELAVRTALGARRRRVIGQLFTESLVLGLTGGGGDAACARAAAATAPATCACAAPREHASMRPRAVPRMNGPLRARSSVG